MPLSECKSFGAFSHPCISQVWYKLLKKKLHQKHYTAYLLFHWQIIYIYSQVYNASYNKSSLTVICHDTRIPSWIPCVQALDCNDFHFTYSKWNILSRCSHVWVYVYTVCSQSVVCAWVCLTQRVSRYIGSYTKPVLEKIHGSRWLGSFMWTSDVWSKLLEKENSTEYKQ